MITGWGRQKQWIKITLMATSVVLRLSQVCNLVELRIFRVEFRAKIPLFSCGMPCEESSLSKIALSLVAKPPLGTESRFLSRKVLGEEGKLPPELKPETLTAAVSVEGQGSSTAFQRESPALPRQRSKVYLLSFWRKAEHWYLSKKWPKPSFKLEILLGDGVGWSRLTLNYRVFLKCISLISSLLLIKPGLADAIHKTLCEHERWLKPWKTWMLQEGVGMQNRTVTCKWWMDKAFPLSC